MGSLLNDVNILITKRVGDLSRLEHIKQTIENNKQLYDSDQKYIEELTEKHLFPNSKHDNIPEVKASAIIKEESKDEFKKESQEIQNEMPSQGTFCGNCGGSKGQDQDFCPNCGASVKPQEESFCPKCGNKIIGNGSCPNCNSPQSNQRQQNNPNQMRQRPYEWKSEGTTLILTVLLGIIGLGGIGHIYLGNITRGIVLLIIGIVLVIITLATIGIGLIALIPFAIWVVFDARSKCRYYNDYLEQIGRAHV